MCRGHDVSAVVAYGAGNIGSWTKIAYGLPGFATTSLSFLIAVYANDFYTLLVSHGYLYFSHCDVQQLFNVGHRAAEFSSPQKNPKALHSCSSLTIERMLLYTTRSISVLFNENSPLGCPCASTGRFHNQFCSSV